MCQIDIQYGDCSGVYKSEPSESLSIHPYGYLHLSLLKSPGRKKKSERRGWEEDEESAEKLGKSMQRKPRGQSHGSQEGNSQEGKVGCQMLLSSVVKGLERSDSCLDHMKDVGDLDMHAFIHEWEK